MLKNQSHGVKKHEAGFTSRQRQSIYLHEGRSVKGENLHMAGGGDLSSCFTHAALHPRTSTHKSDI